MLNILILLGGKGTRFKQTHTFPKPLISVEDPKRDGTIPMIQMVIENLNLAGRYIFILSEELYNTYAIKELLEAVTKPNKFEIIIEKPPIYGAAFASLLAEQFINTDEELLTVNCDQWFDIDLNQFLKFVRTNKGDGSCITFNSYHPKWSFCAVNELGEITEVVEKKPISNHANTGLYFFSKGKEFVSGVKQMIEEKNTFNNEYYIAPVFNYLIQNNAKILNYPIAVSQFLGTGTPEDLDRYEKIIKERKLNV